MKKKPGWLLAMLTFAALAATVSADERSSIWQSLQDVDSNFAEDARRFGTVETFLKYLADDAVVFRRGPVNARRIYEGVDSEQSLERTVESRAHYFDFSRS
jgi:hypothetical protein